MTAKSIVLMGVSGSGKSTVGPLLADALGSKFLDGDNLHSSENIARMAAGLALDDSDRMPWLDAVGERLATGTIDGEGVVIACSALKRRYRDVLRDHAEGLFIVFLDGPLNLINERIVARNHHFMPTSLLKSQFQILEPLAPDERGIRIDIRSRPQEIVDQIRTHLDSAHNIAASVITSRTDE